MLHFEYHREPDSILNPRGYEWHRARQGGVDKRKLAHTRAWQAWIEENHPAEATAYELRKYQKERELKRQSEQDQKEARSWGWKPDE